MPSGSHDAGRRTSAWLPPALALGWLAVVSSVVNSVFTALTTWAATVGLAIMFWRSGRRGLGPPAEPPAASASSTSADSSAQVSDAHPAPGAPAETTTGVSPGGPTPPEQAAVAEVLEIPMVKPGAAAMSRVLTAAEVAEVLRVDVDTVVAAIDRGELPGNRIGEHWRVQRAALLRWLSGGYGLGRDEL